MNGNELATFCIISEQMLIVGYMAIPVVEFSREGYKIRKVFG